MLIIPGIIISMLTFPGVILHEASHLLACKLCKIKVHKVCYFRFGNPAGYVIHEQTSNSGQQIFISIAPFLFSTFIGIALGLFVIANLNPDMTIVQILVGWLGVSIAMHAFPSTGDAKSLWKTVWKRKTNVLLKICSIPLVSVIYLINIGSIFFADLVFAFFVVLIIPKWFF